MPAAVHVRTLCSNECNAHQEYCTCMANAQPLCGHTKVEIGQPFNMCFSIIMPVLAQKNKWLFSRLS